MSKLETDLLTPPAAQSRTESGGKVVQLHRSDPSIAPHPARPITTRECGVLDENSFRQMIAVERKRTERSGQPFLLMLLDAGSCLPSDSNGKVLGQILGALSLATREIDVTGWYKTHSVVGVMFTEISVDDRGSILGTVMSRVSETLRNNLSLHNFSQISIALHVFPEDWNEGATQGNPTLYPDLLNRHEEQSSARVVKRLMDIAGSASALLVLSPIFFLVALLVKLSSKGPIFFKQERLGQFGKPFIFLKFRSMYANNDRKIHQEFIKRVIKGEHHATAQDGGKAVYKMTNDPRITRIGRFIRRTSLDELPQFVNVLRGDMSLVGPRPPIAYECEEYEIWHRRRVLEVKPGITGLWQVRGRSRVRFDDMVRLDLQYASTWSLWLDIQILLQTPRALFSDDAF
jgi:lipopolysaccharide/colanic/teichoic acid biosynthesis glycosyltransferase